jgi:hypothetical protein
VALVEEVIEGGAAGLHALPGQRLAGIRVEHVGDHPGLHVVSPLVAGPVERTDFGHAVALLDAVHAQEVLDHLHVVLGKHVALRAAAGENGRVLREDVLHAALEAGLRQLVHERVGPGHEDPLAGQLCGHAGEEGLHLLGTLRLHGLELGLPGQELGIDLHPIQLAAGGRGAELARQEHQIRADRVGVEGVEAALVVAREFALQELHHAKMPELALRIVRPDHVDDGLELLPGRLLPEGLEQEEPPQLHVVEAAVLVLRNDRDRPGGAGGGDDPQLRARVEALDPIVDAFTVRAVDAGKVLRRELL